MSLYRTYRPHTFADVYGQDHVITTLTKAAKNDKLAHAYLFAGSRGTGKTSVARILAKLLMTRGIEDEKVRVQIEDAVDEGSIVDLLEIDAASNRGIDDVRDLIEKIQFSPVVASAKVYIIDEVHMLTKEAFNALLKTLEEPPAYAYFILATTELNKIPATIQSRCQCFPFRRISEDDIISRLQFIADQEKITIDREALRAIAHVSEGGLRDAISLMDQMRSLDSITLEEVQKRIGTTGSEFVDEVFVALHASDQSTLLEIVSRIEQAGIPMEVFARQLLSRVRTNLHAAVESNAPLAEHTRAMDVLLQALRDMRSAPLTTLVLESALLELTGEASEAPPPPAPKKEVQPAPAPVPAPKKEESVVEEKEEAEEKAPEPEEKKTVEHNAIIEAPEVSLESIQSAWSTIVSAVNPASVKMSLKNARVLSLDGTTIILGFSSAFHRDKVNETDSSRGVEEVLENHFKTALKISCTLEDSGSGDGGSDVVNLADAAAEIF